MQAHGAQCAAAPEGYSAGNGRTVDESRREGGGRKRLRVQFALNAASAGRARPPLSAAAERNACEESKNLKSGAGHARRGTLPTASVGMLFDRRGHCRPGEAAGHVRIGGSWVALAAHAEQVETRDAASLAGSPDDRRAA